MAMMASAGVRSTEVDACVRRQLKTTKRRAIFHQAVAKGHCHPSSARKEPATRKLIVSEFISVDGIAEVEKLPGVTWNDEMQNIQGR
ncbi:hypothetical protein [Mesorhizobium sp. M1136]|uniref:hypothetical protein n=1 Tax=unclassified Mesorhizobium TaxID=325217 RepID=UPI00333C9644